MEEQQKVKEPQKKVDAHVEPRREHEAPKPGRTLFEIFSYWEVVAC